MLLRRSRSAVDRAIKRFRDDDRLVVPELAFPLFAENGILFELATSFQRHFTYEIEVYTRLGMLAEDSRINDADTIRKQKEWCHKAVNSLLPASLPVVAPANTVESDAREAAP